MKMQGQTTLVHISNKDGKHITLNLSRLEKVIDVYIHSPYSSGGIF